MASQTTTYSPPAYLQPYLQYGLQQSLNQYQGGGPQYYPGNTVTPFSPQTEQALQMAQQRATQGSPVTQAAQGYATDVLNGNYLQGNPYADAMFNKAALSTQNQLASQFAGAGRNIGASAPVRADQLNSLANQFYYQNYNDERNRQQGIVPYANSLANQDYTDISQLANVGGTVEDLTSRLIADQQSRYNYAQNQPIQNLNTYLNQVQGGYPGQQVSQPINKNTGASVLGGALLGSSLGSSLFPDSDYGGILGAIGGGLLGGWGG